MMLYGNLGKSILVVLICLLMFSVVSSAVLAAEPHEDPETAKTVFSDVALLRYYSDSLDFVLGKNPAEVEARLEKMPFARIPPRLEEASDSFVAASTNISHLVVWIDADLGKLEGLVGQFRLDEALALAGQISVNLSRASSNLTLIEQATETTGEKLKISSAPAGSDLRSAYDGMVERINRIREMLALYADLTGEQLKLMDIIMEGLFKSTHITLEIEPMIAFVGDDTRFGGVLTIQGEPLAGREVDILVNGSRNFTVRTDADGRYQGVFSVPYRYIPGLVLQALYYPRDKDLGLYLASVSPIVKLKVLFYEARLEVTVEPSAYPGRETTVSGRFDYGQSPPPNERKVEIYLDGFLMTEAVAQGVFAQKIKIDAKTEVGKHIITVSSAAVGRYAPVVASAILSVTRATSKLGRNLPPVILTPGGIGLEGILSSEVGPLSEALTEMGLGGSQVELVSSGEGALETRKQWWMVWALIGWQEVVIKVIPKEPGATPLIFTTRVLVVNVVNLGIFLALLAILGLFISWRLKRFRVFPLLAVLGPFLSWILKRFRVFPRRRRVRPTVAVLREAPAPASSDSVSGSALAEEKEPDSREPRHRIFYWYRLVVRFLLRIARVSLRPQQTLREFAYEHSRLLGPGARYFNELTRMVERLLYSQYRPTEADVENSRQLSIRVEEESKEELKGEGI